MNLTLGSLFDGSGGFPLAATLCGIEPKWASEVEPYPIAVTRSRFPNMKHLGDISKINGAEIEPVDIISFGSPCQDLSVAGKRAGLKHESNGDEETTRSGLFMEAVRIIKEMRKATNGAYPRFALWENVPGAFSSNNGEDFRIVCEELIKVVEPKAVMPPVPKAGWAYADSYLGDGWSLAYRVFDAQYWGVPQRRRRIYLVADFRGECAREVLFEREGLRGYFEKSGTERKAVTEDAEGCSLTDDRARGFDGYNGDLTEDKSSTLGVNCGMSTGRNGVVVPYTLKIRGGVEVDSAGKAAGKGALIQTNLSATLGATNDQYLFQPICFEPGAASRLGGHCYEDKCGTLRVTMGDNQVAVVYSVENHPADSRVNLDESGKVQTLTSRMGTGGGNVPMVMETFSKSRRAKSPDDFETWKHSNTSNTLNTFDNGDVRATDVVVETIALEGNGQRPSHRGDGYSVTDKSYTLNATEVHGVAYGLDRASFNQGKNAKYDFSVVEEQAPTLTARGPGAVCHTDKPNSSAYSFDPGASRDVGVLFIEECAKTLTNGTCPGHHDGVVISQPIIHASKASFFMNAAEGVADTFVATDYKDPQLVAYNDRESRVKNQYIVRRLTPTECARLQGFADKHGHIEPKDHLTEEEMKFWQEVRDTYDIVIKGKDPKDLKTYNEKQMLTWYNKLHTDSAEYKMWGNGIALPTALYCMQGISDVLSRDKAKISKWLDDLLGS